MNIVVAFNDSEDSRAAVAWGAHIAQHAGGEVHLAFAVPAPAVPMGTGPRAVEDLMAGATADATKLVEATVADLAKRGVKASAHVRRWLVVSTVIELAKDVGASLIVVGRRGSTRAKELLIGTVSSEIVRLAPASVLVVRKTDPPKTAGKILVAVDGSPHAVKAAKVARSTFPDADLVLCHVEAPDAATGAEVIRKSAEAGGLDPKSVSSKVLRGDPAGVMLDELATGGYGAIVLGPRGLGLLAGLLLGSVSEKVLQLAKLPVLIAR